MNSLAGDGERDVYSVNFLGNSFKFSIHPVTNLPVFLGQKNKFKIEKTSSTNPNGTGWKLTDEQGVKYFFEAYEVAETESNSLSYFSTWYLTKIESQDATININYTSVPWVELLPAISEKYAYGYENTEAPYASLGQRKRIVNYNRLRNQLYLSSIETNSQTVTFVPKSRSDIRNGLALDEIVVTQKANQNVIKRYKLTHEYFTGCSKGSDVKTEGYIISRLKLTGLYRTDGTNKTEKYDFTYNETQLPYKTSFSQDYWGYYNGEENKYSGTMINEAASCVSLFPTNRSLIPSPVDLFIGNRSGFEQLVNETPDNAVKIEKSTIQRAASKNYITAGMLKSITYPTGGKTEFEFEPHTFSNYVRPCVEDMNTLTYNSGATTTTYQVFDNNYYASPRNVKVTVEKDAKATLTAEFHSSPTYSFYDMEPSYVSMATRNGSNAIIKTLQMESSLACSSNPNCDMLTFDKNHYVKKTISFDLPAGKDYPLDARLSSSIPDQGNNTSTGVNGTLTVTIPGEPVIFSQAANMKSFGGGLRIKKITNYDSNGVIISSKNYNYVNIDGKTSGILIYPINFYNKNQITIKIPGTGGEFDPLRCAKTYTPNIHTFSSGNSFASSPHACGNTVGYSRIEISDATQNNGKEIKEFTNVPGSFYNDFLFPTSTNQLNNGNMIISTLTH